MGVHSDGGGGGYGDLFTLDEEAEDAGAVASAARAYVRAHRPRYAAFVERHLHTLDAGQRTTHDAILRAAGGLHFVYGDAGVGKTLTLRVFAASERRRGRVVLTVASTGIVALNHDGFDSRYGQTAHTAFGVPVVPAGQETGDLTSRISQGSAQAKFLAIVDTVIWDELGASHRKVWECVDRLMRMLRACEEPMGGAKTLCAFDLMQVAPVVQGFGSGDSILASVRFSPLWPAARLHRLTVVHRYLLPPPPCISYHLYGFV